MICGVYAFGHCDLFAGNVGEANAYSFPAFVVERHGGRDFGLRDTPMLVGNLLKRREDLGKRTYVAAYGHQRDHIDNKRGRHRRVGW